MVASIKRTLKHNKAIKCPVKKDSHLKEKNENLLAFNVNRTIQSLTRTPAQSVNYKYRTNCYTTPNAKLNTNPKDKK